MQKLIEMNQMTVKWGRYYCVEGIHRWIVSHNNDTPSESPQQRSAHRASAATPSREKTDARFDAEPKPTRGQPVRLPVWKSLWLRPAFPAAVVSLASTPAPQTRRADNRHLYSVKAAFKRRLLPEHNYSHSTPLHETGSGSFPRALFYRQGFPPLTAFVALPSYIPSHSLPSAWFQRGEAVMLCRCAAEKGAPPPGIVAPLASDSQEST